MAVTTKTFKGKSKVTSRGGFEPSIIKDLNRRGVVFHYEDTPIPYQIEHVYTPDFRIGDILIEAKGYFRLEAQRKMRMVKKQHPDLDIRFIFQNPNSTIQGAKRRKDGTKMTCGEWADKQGYPYAHATVPRGWLEE